MVLTSIFPLTIGFGLRFSFPRLPLVCACFRSLSVQDRSMPPSGHLSTTLAKVCTDTSNTLIARQPSGTRERLTSPCRSDSSGPS
jgi:hypothetical protein